MFRVRTNLLLDLVEVSGIRRTDLIRAFIVCEFAMSQYCHQLFLRWGSLGRDLSQNKLAWKCARGFKNAGMSYLCEKEKIYKVLLKKSGRRFGPLDDPFAVDLGLHKWLSDAREEAYSSWLAWVLMLLGKSKHVGEVFSVDFGYSVEGIRCELEEWVHEGHVGQSGKIDILVHFQEMPALVIEVKVGDADDADTGKQTGYAKSFGKKKTFGKSVKKILLASSGEKSLYEGRFVLRKWDQVCVNIRRLVPILGLNLTQKAIVLAFVGAVEQNIADLPDISSHIAMGLEK